MAKKKDESAESTPKFDAKKALSKFEKIKISGNSITSHIKKVIPVSPRLDLVLGGGIPEGSMVVVTGKQKVGKTTTCLDFAATAQKPEWKATGFDKVDREVYFFSVENRLNARDAEGISGLDLDRFHLIKSTPGNILYAEDHLEMLLALMETKPGAIFIMDSVSQLCSRSRAANGMGRFRDDVPLFLASLTRMIPNTIPIYNSILMLITHQIANQNPASRKTWIEASGNKIQYQADVKLRASHHVPYMEDGLQVGQLVQWECETSAAGAPGGKCESLLRYGEGLDKTYEVMEIATDLGVLEKAGSWYTTPDGSVQGKGKMTDYLKEHPEFYQDINTQCREALGIK